jgi:diguanylate cyclase (GGDEF)-like protein/PAS domain S-box-containing protein
MPASVPLTGQRIIQGHTSALELVVPEDVIVVIETWTQARQSGAARGLIHLASDPERSVVLHYVDALHRYGVYLGLFEVESDDALMTALDEAPTLRPRVALVHKDELAFIRHIDEATSQLLGWSPEEMAGRRSLEFIDPEDHARAIANWMDMLRAPGARRRVRLRHRHRDGSWVWFEVTNHNLLNDPAHRCVVTEMVDITDEMLAQEALRAREYLLRRLTEALPLGIFQLDADRRLVYGNSRLGAILGNKEATSLEAQLAHVLPSDRSALEHALATVLREGRDQELEIGLGRRGKRARRCHLSLRALLDERGLVTGAIACVVDITESVRLRQALEDRATFDVLTRCHNRAAILQVLEQALAEPGQAGTAAIFVDLDRFKQVNDRLGHAAGDALLVAVAEQLRQNVRGLDVVGRFGGDEFLVVCARVQTSDRAVQIAERIAAAIGRTEVVLGGERVRPAASIGLAWSNQAGLDADALVARADQAMYASKRQRLGRPVLFEPGPDQPRAARHAA